MQTFIPPDNSMFGDLNDEVLERTGMYAILNHYQKLLEEVDLIEK